MATRTSHLSFLELAAYHTNFSDLRDHAIRNAKSAYGNLPLHSTLQFDTLVDQDLPILFPQKSNLAPARLVLGYKKRPPKSTQTPVYAYICKKDGISKAFMRLGVRPLRVASLDSVDFVEPFDRLYDIYGMTERALDRMSRLAGYYFLAAGHVESITSRVDFKEVFIGLCMKLTIPVSEGITLLVDDAKSSANVDMVHNTSTKNSSYNYGESHRDNKATQRNASVIAAQLDEPHIKTLNIDDLLAFVTAYKKLQSDNAELQADKSNIPALRALHQNSITTEVQLVEKAHTLQSALRQKEKETNDLQQLLNENCKKKEEACKKLSSVQYELGLLQVKTHTTEYDLREAKTKIAGLKNTISQLKAVNVGLGQDLKAAGDSMRVQIGEMRSKAESLEAESKEAKDRLEQYKTRIREATFGF